MYEGFRVEGTERVDKEYLLSGLASLEAKLFTEDKFLREELRKLDPNKSGSKRAFEDDAKVYAKTHKQEPPIVIDVELLKTEEYV